MNEDINGQMVKSFIEELINPITIEIEGNSWQMIAMIESKVSSLPWGLVLMRRNMGSVLAVSTIYNPYCV